MITSLKKSQELWLVLFCGHVQVLLLSNEEFLSNGIVAYAGECDEEYALGGSGHGKVSKGINIMIDYMI